MTEDTYVTCPQEGVSLKFYQNGLHCPCGFENLHHDRVTIFNREEDESRVRVAETDGISCVMSIQDNKESDNPSSRRDGIIIDFWCEAGCKPRLAIYQHKGTTYFKWI